MKTVHVTPGHSAGASLRVALRNEGRDEEVLLCPDDLSCGPIFPDNLSVRVEWWERSYEDADVKGDLEAFWKRVAAIDDRLVVWFGRGSASELAFLLAFADRAGVRPFSVVDITGFRYRTDEKEHSRPMSEPARAVSILPDVALKLLLGTDRLVTEEQRDRWRQRWRLLKQENAPSRVATEAGLVSAPADYYDSLLMDCTATKWTKAAHVVGEAMGSDPPYLQIGDVMLLGRLVALIEQGRLLADGDPWDMRSCRVRRP